MTIQYNSNYDGTVPFSDTAAQYHLAASADLSFTVPGDNTMQYQALFSYNLSSNVFVCINATAVIPTSGTLGTQKYNEFKPEKRYVRGGDVIHLITPDVGGAYAGVSLRMLQG